MERKKIIQIICIIWAIVLSITVIVIVYNLSGGQKECVAKKCKLWATGDEWISHNCRPVEGEEGLFCKITVDNMEYENIPLQRIKDEVGLENVKSCIDYDCLTDVYIWKHEVEIK